MKTTKKVERNKNRKRKLAALVNLVKMNDNDRLEEAVEKESESDTEEKSKKEGTTLDDNNGGFTIVTYKKKSNKKEDTSGSEFAASPDCEPQPKRIKLTSTSDENNYNIEDLNNSDSINNDSNHPPKDNLTLTDEQYIEMRRHLRDRKRQLDIMPSLRLQEFGYRALLHLSDCDRTPIFLTDIQHLLMEALIGNESPCKPTRWCQLGNSNHLSHSVVLILEGFSLYHYMSNESKFRHTNQIFDTRLELILPPCKDGIIEEIAKVPLTNVQAQDLIDQHGSLESAIEMNKDPTLLVKSIFPIESESVQDNLDDLPEGDKFSRTKLLLSALQMVDEGYPMPLRGELHNRFKNYVFTKQKYAIVTNHSPLFGVDCEMCRTTSGSNELTRISIVNEKMDTIYETLVMPENKITDYLTPYSGITPDIMKSVTKTLQDVQNEVGELLPPDAILVGQSLNSDLNAMKMMHPYVIDTSVCFNLSGIRKRKSKLQKLALIFLNENIQKQEQGHDSVEDSLASLKLVKLKLANNVEFGDIILTQKKRLNDIIRITKNDEINNNLLAHASKRDKKTAIVSAGELQQQVKDIIQKAENTINKNELKTVSLFQLDTNKAAVKKTREIALEHSLTISNLQFDMERIQFDSIDKTIEKLDKWIGKIWKSIALNGMFLVLMGGSSECPSGVAKIAIKKNIVIDVNTDLTQNK